MCDLVFISQLFLLVVLLCCVLLVLLFASLSLTHTRLTARFPGLPGEPVPRKFINLDFTEARDSEWQWHQLGLMQVCTSLQTDNHTSTPPLSFLQTGCPSCRPTNSVKALKAKALFASLSALYVIGVQNLLPKWM